MQMMQMATVATAVSVAKEENPQPPASTEPGCGFLEVMTGLSGVSLEEKPDTKDAPIEEKPEDDRDTLPLLAGYSFLPIPVEEETQTESGETGLEIVPSLAPLDVAPEKLLAEASSAGDGAVSGAEIPQVRPATMNQAFVPQLEMAEALTAASAEVPGAVSSETAGQMGKAFAGVVPPTEEMISNPNQETSPLPHLLEEQEAKPAIFPDQAEEPLHTTDLAPVQGAETMKSSELETVASATLLTTEGNKEAKADGVKTAVESSETMENAAPVQAEVPEGDVETGNEKDPEGFASTLKEALPEEGLEAEDVQSKPKFAWAKGEVAETAQSDKAAIFNAYSRAGGEVTESASTTQDISPPVFRETKAYLQIEEKIAGQIQEGNTTFKLKLYPEGLGEVTVNLTCHGGKLAVDIVAGSSATQRLLEGQAGDLKSALETKNYEITEFDVSTDNGNQQNAYGQGGNGEKDAQSNTAYPWYYGESLVQEEAAATMEYLAYAGRLNYRV